MATLSKRRPQNVTGNFYVDSSCIDCDTCRWMAPHTFSRLDGQSAVHHQPDTEGDRLQALQALLACPTASIGTVEKPEDIRAVQQSFPIAIAENVYHCGYHSERSYGATSYFITRPAGNILIDSPRFAPPLVKRLEDLGGIRYLYLTHRDDVADHRKFRDRFGCDRILHTDDISTDTQAVEIQLRGSEPYRLADDIFILPVPGHTRGHTVLLYNDSVLFTGDHLAYSASLAHLIGFRNFCWYSWPRQIESMETLTRYSFEWVLPGHGRRFHGDRDTMRKALQDCIDWMKSAA
ncbi:MBL fold metallo-hydrolase [Synechococcus sp. PCC 7336]|uniref:MBL fold metallo-hydrolase n=1 Tax=Synechococcus sp. PCC 7336 TaxID=195250 RepID=UPI0003480F11|nr:MBL fold metallo-hydrolase [Synechococcus sp. PCC 7336]